MNSRQEILDALRETQVPATDLPDLDRDWTAYPDPKAQFVRVLEAVGGQALEVADPAAIESVLAPLEAYGQAERIWSRVQGVPSSGGDWEHLSDPHDFEPLQCCVVAGEFAVAENGAVWLDQEAIPHRAALFVTQHLVLVVDAKSIVSNMHQAYARIAFDPASFGIFISGPSKTADIEQSLVIGAHGARSLTVVLVGDTAN